LGVDLAGEHVYELAIAKLLVLSLDLAFFTKNKTVFRLGVRVFVKALHLGKSLNFCLPLCIYCVHIRE
jgi:hypothetical protein